MAITVHLSEILKDRHMTAKELCAKVGITEANLSCAPARPTAYAFTQSTKSATTSTAT